MWVDATGNVLADNHSRDCTTFRMFCNSFNNLVLRVFRPVSEHTAIF
jgi:hypothetical protein